MKSTTLTLAAFAHVLAALACGSRLTADDPKGPPLDTSFLKLYAETRGFMLGRPQKPKITPDGKAVLFLRSEPKTPKLKLYEFAVATGKTKELLSPESLLKGADENLTPEEMARRERQRITVGGFADYHLDKDGKRVLVKLSNRLYVLDRESGKVAELKTGTEGAIVDPKWSPDGKLIAYVRGHDVYVYDLAAEKESAVTTGGTQVKTHGLAEFVAQEEMGRHSGYWWSPDSKSIAYTEADHTGVEQWFIADPLKPDAAPTPQYYPRPGKKNVSVRLGVKPTAGGETVWVEWSSDADGKGAPKDWMKKESIFASRWQKLFLQYEYLSSVVWMKDRLIAIVHTRDQRGDAFACFNPKTGKLQDDTQTHVSRGWLNVPTDLTVSKGGEMVYFVSGEALCGEGFDESTVVFMTCSNVAASELFGVTEKPSAAIIGYRSDPTVQHVYRHSLDPKNEDDSPLQLTIRAGIHAAAVAKSSDLLVLTSTSLDSLPQSVVRGDEKHLGTLPSVALEPPFKPNVTVEKVGDYWTAIVRPRDFDPKKMYPVVVDVYGGPKHLHVVQAMRNWLVPQWLADQGFIVVAIDNRGTPGRGRDWEKAIYQKFGTVPIEDQVKGLHALCDKFPELDLLNNPAVSRATRCTRPLSSSDNSDNGPPAAHACSFSLPAICASRSLSSLVRARPAAASQ
jgi:dipeptidyl-peptidase-4